MCIYINIYINIYIYIYVYINYEHRLANGFASFNGRLQRPPPHTGPPSTAGLQRPAEYPYRALLKICLLILVLF